MPVISRFYGIIIKMYFQQKEHNPRIFMQYMNNQAELLNIWQTQNFKQLEPLE